ncbi:MAG: FAD-dependent oxidoreductase [Chitinivibrionales bacterium]|nr:FAD-dependent oxidoreductase [Chitinivibrionales bacterium]
MPNEAHEVDVLIVGAGMAGLAAATELRDSGMRVLVIEQDTRMGGRVASGRIGDATFDYGAQFMTARDPRFASLIDRWCRAGAAEEWYRSDTGHPHWRGKPAMAAIVADLADDLDIRLEARITQLRTNRTHWQADLDNGEAVLTGAVVLTPPAPQSLALLDRAGVELLPAVRARVADIAYEPCISVMAVLDGPARVPSPGGLSPAQGPIAWIADNQKKGVSGTPAVTIHADAAYSRSEWERDRQETGLRLLEAAEPWLGSRVSSFEVYGWPCSKPVRVEQRTCLIAKQTPPLVLAGDAFAGPRIEGAVLSGWSAANVLKRNRIAAVPARR